MTEKLILTDVDGVLLDWDAQFAKWMTIRGYSGLVNPTSYDMAERYGIEPKIIYKMVEQFNCSAAFGFCEAYRDAIPYVRMLANRGYKFHAITSMGGDEYSRRLRGHNLREWFGDGVFVDFTALPLQGGKKEILSQYAGSGLWWIEDKLENAEVGLEVGLRPILMSATHNEHYDGEDIIIADNWKEVHNIISDEESL